MGSYCGRSRRSPRADVDKPACGDRGINIGIPLSGKAGSSGVLTTTLGVGAGLFASLGGSYTALEGFRIDSCGDGQTLFPMKQFLPREPSLRSAAAAGAFSGAAAIAAGLLTEHVHSAIVQGFIEFVAVLLPRRVGPQ